MLDRSFFRPAIQLSSWCVVECSGGESALCADQCEPAAKFVVRQLLVWPLLMRLLQDREPLFVGARRTAQHEPQRRPDVY